MCMPWETQATEQHGSTSIHCDFSFCETALNMSALKHFHAVGERH